MDPLTHSPTVANTGKLPNHTPKVRILIRYAHLGDCVSRKSPSNWVGLELHICNEVLLLLTAFSARMISITRERTSCVRTVVDTRTTTFLVGASTAVPHLGWSEAESRFRRPPGYTVYTTALLYYQPWSLRSRFDPAIPRRQDRPSAATTTTPHHRTCLPNAQLAQHASFTHDDPKSSSVAKSLNMQFRRTDGGERGKSPGFRGW